MKLKIGLEKSNFSSKWSFHKPTVPKFDANFRPKIIAVDTETTGLSWAQKDRPFALSMAWEQEGEIKTAYWDWPVDPFSRMPHYEEKNRSLNLFSKYYCDPLIPIVFANAKFDLHHIFSSWSIIPQGNIFDVLVAAWYCNTQEPSYGLKPLSLKYLKFPDDDKKLLQQAVIDARKKAKKLSFNTSNKIKEDYWLVKLFNHKSKLCESYAVNDVIRTLQLWWYYEEALKYLKAEKTFKVECQLTKVLFEMELRGIRFFEDKCLTEIEALNKKVKEQEEFVRIETQRFNLNLASPKQLVKLLYNSSYSFKPLPLTDLTPTGLPSTATEVLEKHRDNPIVEAILKYRGYSTGRNHCKNYIALHTRDETLNNYDFPHLQRKSVHPNFNQINTSTGRLSCNHPNLQNVADSESSNGLFVTDARSMFGPRNGFKWYCIDYKQLEARIFAALAEEKEMIRIFNDPTNDPFTVLGDRIYGNKFGKGKQRKITKNVFYCKIFGGGPGVLARKYHVEPIEFATRVLREIGNMYPGIFRCQKSYENFGRTNGYINTIVDRRISIPSQYPYKAISYAVQGSASDIIKRAMIRTATFLKETELDAHLVLSIHDELIFEIREDHCYKWLIKRLKTIMEDNKDILAISTPCKVDKTKTSWSSSEKKSIKI